MIANERPSNVPFALAQKAFLTPRLRPLANDLALSLKPRFTFA